MFYVNNTIVFLEKGGARQGGIWPGSDLLPAMPGRCHESTLREVKGWESLAVKLGFPFFVL